MSCATYFDPTPTDCLSRVDFDQHLVFICSGNGADFNRCAYLIDLTQYRFSCLHPYVTVYPVSDYDRTATLIYSALDRIRFWRRIERTELIRLPILTDVLKLTIRMNRLSISANSSYKLVYVTYCMHILINKWKTQIIFVPVVYFSVVNDQY